MSQAKRNSGQPKQKWTEEEEQALKHGVTRYGVGKWRLIQKDESCGPILANRSNVDLKDKWRNLNMEARDKELAKSADPDLDFQKENQRRKRRSRRSSLHACSAPTEAAVTSGLSEQDIEQPSEGHAGCNDMTWNASPINTQSVGGSQVHPVNTAQLQALHNADMCMADKSDFPDASPESDQHSPMIADMVVAAVISMQDPLGSGPDEICSWIEAHYHVVHPQHVQPIMTRLIKAGRLQQVPQHPSLVCMGSVLNQLSKQNMAAAQSDPTHPQDHLSHLFDSDKIAAEHALLAAQAVMQAEEASRMASSLLEAAHQLHELEHPLTYDLHDEDLTVN